MKGKVHTTGSRLGPVGQKEYLSAIEALESRGFTINEWLEQLDLDKLLSKPLGPTPACLSAEDLDTALTAEMENRRDVAAEQHLATCKTCKTNLDLYRSVVTDKAVEEAKATVLGTSIRVVPATVVAYQPDLNLRLAGMPAAAISSLDITCDYFTARLVQKKRLSRDTIRVVSGVFQLTGCAGPFTADALQAKFAVSWKKGVKSLPLFDRVKIRGTTKSGDSFICENILKFAK